MNNKGFTLIEIIMVISVLAMLALLSAPNVVNLIKKNKVDNYNNVIDSIIEATELYVSNNRYKLIFNENCAPKDTKDVYSSVKLNVLINNSNLSSPVKNYCLDEELGDDTEIKIILSCKTRQFSYDIIENDKLKRRSDADGNSISGVDGLKISSCDELY